MANKKEVVCLYCKNSVSGIRVDKKFCNDECRVSYHNELNRDSSKFMANINKTLRRNRRILADLNISGKAKATRAQLLDEGFSFSYFTNQYKTKAGKLYTFCYDQGYIELEPHIYGLVVKHEYVE
jgi:hypothetical protein